ncbi:glycosyltransferase family 2 protein [Peristeroidobacter soli]|uniref:glycosyltransferase family 2 protein n=1 Tax=Peristeroidobacter soli TaxID=2497877 RepID=UPI00101C4BBE|nr:glycosyltransferase [Peristeroidobacter soli]
MSIKLSICIATMNRGSFIGDTLDSIINQATSDCEIVVLDGASTDDTAQVVAARRRRFERLRYIRQAENNGIDQDFDRAVELSRGEYCWLFSDDDLLKTGALNTVLRVLQDDFSLVLVNGEHRDFTMTKVHVPNFFMMDSDKVYSAGDMDGLFADLGRCLICICCVVIKRSVWLERDRKAYYGSRFIHMGVIFQQPLPQGAYAISSVLMSLRLGNAQTHARDGFLVWYIKLPWLIWSLPISEATKISFSNPEPWKDFTYLLALRSVGAYSSLEYKRSVRPLLQSVRSRVIPMLVGHTPRKVARWLGLLISSVGKRYKLSHTPWKKTHPDSWNQYVDGLEGGASH